MHGTPTGRPDYNTVSLVPNSALQHTASERYRQIKKTLMFEDEDTTSKHAPSQPRRRRLYNASPEMDSDSEVKQHREHRIEETRQKRRSTADDRAVNTTRRLLDHEVQFDRHLEESEPTPYRRPTSACLH